MLIVFQAFVMGYGDIVICTVDGNEYQGFEHGLVSLPGDKTVPGDVQAGIANALIACDMTVLDYVTVGGQEASFSDRVVKSFAKALLEETKSEAIV